MQNHCTLYLDVDTVDLTAFDALKTELLERGISFATLADEQAQQPDWLIRFTEMDNATRTNDPYAPRTVEEMPERLAFLGVVPEALFLAKCGEQYIGYTLLNVNEEDGTCLRQGWTGVRPEYRRQGIATVLKMLGIAYARQHDYQQIVTEPRTTNLPSIGMSTKVGFRELLQEAS